MAISKATLWFAKGSLMAIAIYLGSTVLIHYSLLPPSQSKQGGARKEGEVPEKIKQSPEDAARFQSSFETGNKALSDGLYATALDNFLEAERSASPLTDEQYNALKGVRLHIAQAYESLGDTSAANGVYRAMADCANRDGDTLLKTKSFEDALARGWDAKDLSEQLGEGKRDSLFAATSVLTGSLSALGRYSEAAEAQQRYIDFLKASAEPHDPALIQAYSLLDGIYSDAKDWHGAEEALVQVIKLSDGVDLGGISILRNWAQYNLVIAYNLEGNTDKALSSAEDFYTEYLEKERDISRPTGVVFHASNFAELALQIATNAKRQNDIDLWHKRGAFGPNGGISVIALRPPGTH